MLRNGRMLLHVLREIERESINSDAHVIGALRVRRQLDSALIEPPMVLLMFLVENVTQPSALRTAIWLLGRCRRMFGINSIAKHRYHPLYRVRAEVIRALRRINAADTLQEIAAIDPDERLRAWAHPPAPLSLVSRIRNFTQLVRRVPAQESRSESMSFDVVRASGGKPPRSPEQLRQQLERIRGV